jgi:tetratricopeptide (TPR) repeat protein
VEAIQSAEAHHQRGRELTGAGKLPQAVAELTEAIRLKPNLALAWNARGYAYLRMRDYSHAIADFSEAIRLNPAYANAWHNRAAARRASGDRAGADADAKKASALERR